MVLLWVAGGASRADTMAQVVVRAGCWGIFVISVLFGPRPDLGRTLPVLLMLLVTIALPVIQLIPLPPAWWEALPGRHVLLIPGESIPWRPWTMTPGATWNALFSLIVPTTMLLLLMQANERTHRWLLPSLLVMIFSAVLLGLLQFSGAGFNNPLLNDIPGLVSSIFANRNHFALLVAVGCLIAPVWAVMDRDALRRRVPMAGGMVLLFILTILTTGSRTALILGGLSLILSFLMTGRRVRRWLGARPNWLILVLILATAVVVGGFVLASYAAGRADAINRLVALDASTDVRSRALPTILSMVASYMPFGSGFGSFEAVFRIHEPLSLLKLTYLNQAHNDYLGVALDGGIVGIAVLGAGILWWLIATIRSWRQTDDNAVLLGRLGSSILFLILVASVTDYPARTPTIMALIVIAAVWLAQAQGKQMRSALPV